MVRQGHCHDNTLYVTLNFKMTTVHSFSFRSKSRSKLDRKFKLTTQTWYISPFHTRQSKLNSLRNSEHIKTLMSSYDLQLTSSFSISDYLQQNLISNYNADVHDYLSYITSFPLKLCYLNVLLEGKIY